jgi:hypothetical protein
MLQELATYFTPREERITVAGVTLVVKEMTMNMDGAGLADGVDVNWKLMVRCVFKEDGITQAFTDDDIPALKGAPTMKMSKLIAAVRRANGMDDEEEKNSEAAQTSSSS